MSAGTGPRIFSLEEAQALVPEGRQPYIDALVALGSTGTEHEEMQVNSALRSLSLAAMKDELQPPLSAELAEAVDAALHNFAADRHSPDRIVYSMVISQIVLGAVVDHGYGGER